MYIENGKKVKSIDQKDNKDDIISRYANEIPIVTRIMFSSINGDDVNWAILVILKKNGPCTLSELQKITSLDKESLISHIKKLINGALIENFIQKKKGIKEFSFYEITILASNLLDSMKNF